MSIPRSALALVFSACVVAAAGAAPASAGIHRFVKLPGPGAPECELASAAPGLGTFVYCEIGPKHALTVQMRKTGRPRICRGIRCLSNAPEGVRTLAYGRSIVAGPFRCTAERKGMRCIVTRLGHGFLLGRTSLTRI